MITLFLLRESNAVQAGPSQNDNQKTSLLVDAYRPKKYIDLVGDDRVHREVLAWVKEWDFCVFGNQKGKKRPRDEENDDLYRRPKEKVGFQGPYDQNITADTGRVP